MRPHLTEDWIASPNDKYFLFKQPIEKPENDTRSYRLIYLQNNLQALVISDPETDRSSAALDVHVGSLSDPDELQGLAHFCEHLSFLGTLKYPKENAYYAYLSEHSGYANAFTASDNTNYHFEIGHQWLEGALDRFAHFFIDPLFAEGCTERELKAVDSEHKKNLQSDEWRISQVEKTLSNPHHPWHRFETGNLETLTETPKRLGINVRERLLEFHANYYSANIMKLCVLGKESLDQLTEWVVDKFSPIPDRSIAIPKYQGHPLTANELTNQLFVKSIMHNRILGITFPFPEQVLYFESQPGDYIAHLISHEGPGSTLSYLKSKGWATALSAGASYGGKGFGFFNLCIELTEEGIKYYEDVIVAIFQYIEMLKAEGAQEWIFKEMQSLAAIAFRFSEKKDASEYTSDLAQQMQENLPPHYCVSGHELVRKFDPALIEEHLKYLRPDNFRFTVSSQELPFDIKCTHVEQWYGTEYDIRPFSQQLKEKLGDLQLNPIFKLPAINEFIPTKLDVVKDTSVECQKRPRLIQDIPGMRLWYKKEDRFWVPKTNIWISLYNPLAYATPRHSALSLMYISLVEDFLTEYSYNASLAGLFYDLDHNCDGLILTVGGYSDKLPLLLEKVLYTMTHLVIDPERFNIVKDNVHRSLGNFFLEAPYQHTSYYMSLIIRERMWRYDDLSTECLAICLQDVMDFCPNLLGQLHIEGLVHGTLEASEALSMFQELSITLGACPVAHSQLVHLRNLNLPAGQHHVYRQAVHDASDLNSAIAYYLQVCDVVDVPLRAKLALVCQIAQEPSFHQLRTQEQLGYIVYSEMYMSTGIMGFRLTIQSERDTVYLESRIEAFLELLRGMIVNMTEEEYAAQVESVIDEREETFKYMRQEGYDYWEHIALGYYEFDKDERDIKELRTIDKASLLSFFDTYICPDSQQRCKLSIHLQAQNQKKKEAWSMADLESLFAGWVSHGHIKECDVASLSAMFEKREFSEQAFSDMLHGMMNKEAKQEDAVFHDLLERMLSELRAIRATSILCQQSLDSTGFPQLAEGAVEITNIIEFKSKMTLARSAAPVQPFYDMM
ncbi:Metalloenzyme, LuxS/M16 peptidase-like protein [Spinellus fusiger]|nr:Metalloenzyme, LuxS/M16 peptidase-like protein [Spinellus fusiger]